jgi:hypothetical protein
MDELEEKDDELKGEVLLPENDDDGVLLEDGDDDLLLHKHGKKIHDDTDEDSLESLADAEEEELAEDSYDDKDLW